MLSLKRMFRPELRLFYQSLFVKLSKKKTLCFHYIVSETGYPIIKGKKIGFSKEFSKNQKGVSFLFFGRGLFIVLSEKKEYKHVYAEENSFIRAQIYYLLEYSNEYLKKKIIDGKGEFKYDSKRKINNEF